MDCRTRWLCVSVVVLCLACRTLSAQSGTAAPVVSAAPGVSGVHVAVVAPAFFQKSMDAWCDYRSRQGYIVHRITTPPVPEGATQAPSPEPIRNEIKKLAATVPLSYLLLVGDGVPRDNSVEEWERVVPVARVASRAIQTLGPENHIASDAWYADLDDDGFPELAVGRWPVTSPEDVLAMTAKVIAYEQQIASGLWQRRMTIVAGMGGFSPVIDRAIEMIVRNIFTELLIPDMELSLTRASWKSAFCPYPPLFEDVVVARINQGSLFWVYIGHGIHRELDKVSTPKNDYDVFRIEDVEHIDCTANPPICLFFACYSGAFDSPEESLAERLVLASKGPVAVLASSRLSMPYAMGVLGVEMFDETKDISVPKTLGMIVRNAKRRMKPSPDVDEETRKTLPSKDRIRLSLDETARLFDPTAKDLRQQLGDHIDSMNLFGDPLLIVRFPTPMQIKCDETIYAAHTLTVTGAMPEGSSGAGEVHIELVLKRSRSAVRSPKRKDFVPSPETEKSFQDLYYAANSGAISETTARLDNGRFTAALPVPESAFGAYTVRAVCIKDNRLYSGTAPLTVRSFDTRSHRPGAKETLVPSR